MIPWSLKRTVREARAAKKLLNSSFDSSHFLAIVVAMSATKKEYL